MSTDESMVRLAEIRAEIEQHEAAVWCLQREADELRHLLRSDTAKALAKPVAGESHAP